MRRNDKYAVFSGIVQFFLSTT